MSPNAHHPYINVFTSFSLSLPFRFFFSFFCLFVFYLDDIFVWIHLNITCTTFKCDDNDNLTLPSFVCLFFVFIFLFLSTTKIHFQLWRPNLRFFEFSHLISSLLHFLFTWFDIVLFFLLWNSFFLLSYFLLWFHFTVSFSSSSSFFDCFLFPRFYFSHQTLPRLLCLFTFLNNTWRSKFFFYFFAADTLFSLLPSSCCSLWHTWAFLSHLNLTLLFLFYPKFQSKFYDSLSFLKASQTKETFQNCCKNKRTKKSRKPEDKKFLVELLWSIVRQFSIVHKSLKKGQQNFSFFF